MTHSDLLDRHHGLERLDLLRRDFNPPAPKRVWLSDITYVRTWEGWLYLAVILDAFSTRPNGASTMWPRAPSVPG